MKIALSRSLAALIAIAVACQGAAASNVWPWTMKVAVWGAGTNNPEWNQQLHVQASRQGCSSSPGACVDSLKSLAVSNGWKIYLSVLLDSRSVEYAREYGQLSRNNPWVEEISYDDFVAQYEKLATSVGPLRAKQLLQGAVQELKNANRSLKFGITLYEFELNSPYLEDQHLPPSFRAQVDYVHLYTAYRANAPLFQEYIRNVRQKFPRARIIGGLYPYDRREYLPCAPNAEKCSVKQEADLFAQGAKLEVQLLKNGQIDWLEMAPGYFGREADIPDWKNDPRSCLPGQIDTCVKNTVALRQNLLEILRAIAGMK